MRIRIDKPLTPPIVVLLGLLAGCATSASSRTASDAPPPTLLQASTPTKASTSAAEPATSPDTAVSPENTVPDSPPWRESPSPPAESFASTPQATWIPTTPVDSSSPESEPAAYPILPAQHQSPAPTADVTALREQLDQQHQTLSELALATSALQKQLETEHGSLVRLAEDLNERQARQDKVIEDILSLIDQMLHEAPPPAGEVAP